MANKTPFTFDISLSVLNHLGRHLYRSFATVLGEAISNAWDADARNVWIYIDRNKKGFWIKDDGTGMNADDFQKKFLKIGYSKRKEGNVSPKRHRPYIGRKGIGKLALLSCADRISVISKKSGEDYVGGVIDNPALDQAITEDLTPQQYALTPVKKRPFAKYTNGHKHGTIIRFEGLKDGVKGSLAFLKKIVALYFRFSLIDSSFKIYLNDEQITYKNLEDLLEKTQFLWKIGSYVDPFLSAIDGQFKKEKGHESKAITVSGAKGFIASVTMPRDLKILATNERVGVDLFVNGRLRERDVLQHIPTARIVENYLYGQIHFDNLDDETDRFTSSREGVVADDPKYKELLDRLRVALLKIVEDWDKWRIRHRNEGDPENNRITPSRRASLTLYGAVANQILPPKGAPLLDEVDQWVDELSTDAAYNFESYAECFVSENVVRKYICEKKIKLSDEAKKEAAKYQNREAESKDKGNISIEIRRVKSDLSYLSMYDLANLVDKRDKNKEACLARDAAEFKPIRDAVAHTALLTDAAKKKLSSVRENIKSRVKTLLSSGK